MSSKRLNQFKGPLDAAQITDGMNAASRNAKRLADDAAILLDNARWPSAVSLAILSIEESGKSSILRRLATTTNPDDLKEIWREYRSHTKKNTMGVIVDHVASGARKLADFAQMFDEDAEHPHLLDQLKQLGFYSDCLGNAHWAEPAKVIDERTARHIVSTAKILASGKEIEPLEIELWIQHVGPFLNASQFEAERALERWYAALQQQGLAPEGNNAMLEFVRSGICTADT
jgi:AbiV family abortive infection protein